VTRWWGALAIVVAAGIDQATKALALASLSTSEPLQLLPFLNLRISYNFGISFGMFNDPDMGSWVIIAPTLAVILAMFCWLMLERQRGMVIGLGLIVGGALGNVIDRVRQGAVTDFIDVFVGSYHWPTFNLADGFLFCGVVTVLLSSFGKRDAHGAE
jgi:lipoprotein signal peptidase